MGGLGLRAFHATILIGALVTLNVTARAAEELPTGLREAITCADARTRVFDRYIDAYSDEPARLDASVAAEPELAAIHRLLTFEINNFALATGEIGERDPLLHLIRLEMRSRLEPEYERINEELDRALAEARRFGDDHGLECAASVDEELRRTKGYRREPHSGEFAYAARRTMATAYQSCEVLDLPAVTDEVEEVKGVERAVRIDSVGWGRKYTDLRELKRTHYYHRVTSFSGNCLNQDRKPLVYDYGGEPAVVKEDGSLDLFSNVGGGPALGIDCSAFVSAAAVSAGGLFSPGTRNRAVFTRFTSRDFINAKDSGWSCYGQVRVEGDLTIQPGDIAAINGHVIMIDSVGADPFGLARLTSPSQCSRLSTREFDFVVIQSSPSKEHLGINRYVARDYLSAKGAMHDLFMRYANQACLSKFDRAARAPSTKEYGIIRHRRTEDCLAARVRLKHEDCVARCASL